MQTLRKPLIWFVLFFVLFALSQDFWNWDGTTALSFFHIPTSIYKLIILQFILAVLIFLFSKTYWKEKEADEGEHVR